MSQGKFEPELRQVREDVYAYLQPDGSWYLVAWFSEEVNTWPLDRLRAFLRKSR